MNILTIIFIGVGLLFFTGGTIGIIRFPDFYTRLHAAGKLDTMGLFLSMLALAIYTIQGFTIGTVLTGFKILLTVVFVFITSPTATHAIMDAGYRAGLRPWVKEQREETLYDMVH